MKIKGLHTTWHYVFDIAKTADFYKSVLGLTPDVESPYWTDFVIGDKKIGLHPGGKQDDKSGWCLGIEVDDVAALKSRLEEHCVPITDDFHETPSGVVLTFLDPDGCSIQAIQCGMKLNDLTKKA